MHETKEIHQITFDRWNDRGVKERCPDRFAASELTSLAQVVDQFGGGTYQFIAFDSRGNFSRWTPEREKVRINLPSKPFRPVERVEAPRESQPSRASQPMPQQNECLMLLIQQMTAVQERTDRLMTMLIERLANPWGARAPQPVSSGSPPSQSPPRPQQPQVPETMAMLMGLATVLEKLRPAQDSDMMGQLSGLASVCEQLNGLTVSEVPTNDIALQPLLEILTNSALQNPATAAPPAVEHQAASALRQQPDMVWVLIPEIGPVMMRIDQATRALIRMAPSPVPRASAIATTAAPTVAMSAAAAATPASTVAMQAVIGPTAPAPIVTVSAPARRLGRAYVAPVTSTLGPTAPSTCVEAATESRSPSSTAPLPLPIPSTSRSSPTTTTRHISRSCPPASRSSTMRSPRWRRSVGPVGRFARRYSRHAPARHRRLGAQSPAFRLLSTARVLPVVAAMAAPVKFPLRLPPQPRPQSVHSRPQIAGLPPLTPPPPHPQPSGLLQPLAPLLRRRGLQFSKKSPEYPPPPRGELLGQFSTYLRGRLHPVVGGGRGG